MKTIELIKAANKNLWRHKLRTFLTVSAIFVGAFTLTLTNSLGDGMRAYIDSEVKNTESKNVLFLTPKSEKKDSRPKRFEYREKSGKDALPNINLVAMDKIESLAAETDEVKSFSPSMPIQGEYLETENGRKYVVTLSTATPGVTYKMQTGKPVTGAGEIVLSYPLAKTINENLDEIIGQNIVLAYKTQNANLKTLPLKISGISTEGVITSYNSYLSSQDARTIYDEQTRGGKDYNLFSRFSFELNTEDEAKIKEIKSALSAKGFEATTLADQSRKAYDSIEIARWGLNLFAFISLLAASFGIINTQVIAVMERTREIGLQKALGMSRERVFSAFALESILLGFWGAITGIITATIFGFVVSRYVAREYMRNFAAYDILKFSPLSFLFITLLICAIALLAGVLPAWRASRLNPIEALRYE